MTFHRAPLWIFLGEALILCALALHARFRRAERDREAPTIAAVVRLMPGADLALAGAARHLRFPSLEEPAAAFADAPAARDLDPAGAAIAPPVDVYREVSTR